MKILITGASGKLGSALQTALRAEHDTIGTNSATLDITDYAACRQRLADLQPDLLLHAAAYTDVNGCAQDPQKALRINGLGTQNLAAVTAQLGIAMLYISSNEVFDGKLGRAYHEYDAAKPINAYGWGKWYGERALAEVNPRHYIVRTAWLFAPGGDNFIHAIRQAARRGRELRVVTNEISNPTYTRDLAAAIRLLIQSDRYGTYHLVNEGAVSRWGLARFTLNEAGFADTAITRISSHQWQRPSQPPEYTPLANIAAASLGIRLRPWQEAVRAFIADEEPG
ncbi:MAG: dTDP-4-dehydrorhamnose reductase [Chloroflexi bacterium]|nr:dTDP-4-dehydrorhamnose reductase [Chloroflexota bacterium]MCY4248159.1 dTDP-4-dehydrorhamnose reductase [Chloroflexota bacterium]